MNNTEKFIRDFYQSICIVDPISLSIESIIEQINVELIHWSFKSAIATYKNRYVLFLNTTSTTQQQWQDFGHEMYHFFFDDAQFETLSTDYVTYSESKADYFAYHFCVPTFMLHKIKGVDVYDLMELFNVEFDFALRRLEMYRNKCLRGGIYEKS